MSWLGGLDVVVSDAVPKGEAYVMDASALQKAVDDVWRQTYRPEQVLLSPRQYRSFRLVERFERHLSLVRKPRRKRIEPLWVWRLRHARWCRLRDEASARVLARHPYRAPYTVPAHLYSGLLLNGAFKITGLGGL